MPPKWLLTSYVFLEYSNMDIITARKRKFKGDVKSLKVF